MEEAEGAVELILRVIKEHKASHTVCKHGCNSLSSIMRERSKSKTLTHPHLTKLTINTGEQKVSINISDVIDATKDYIYDAGLYMTLCDIFCNAQTIKGKY